MDENNIENKEEAKPKKRKDLFLITHVKKLADYLIKYKSEGKIIVCCHMIKSVQLSNNMIEGLQADFAEKAGVSIKTVERAIKSMRTVLVNGEPLIKRTKIGSYMMNPNVMFFGNKRKENFLLVEWRGLLKKDKIPKQA